MIALISVCIFLYLQHSPINSPTQIYGFHTSNALAPCLLGTHCNTLQVLKFFSLIIWFTVVEEKNVSLANGPFFVQRTSFCGFAKVKKKEKKLVLHSIYKKFQEVAKYGQYKLTKTGQN